MVRLWIFLAFIAISGCGAFSYDSDANDGWYDDYWYEDVNDDKPFDADVKETSKSTDGENSDVTKTSPPYAPFGDDVHSINDYLLEDNRSELEEDNFNSDSNSISSIRDDDIDTKDTSEKTNDDKLSLSTETDKDEKELDDPIGNPTRKTENYDEISYLNNDSEKKILEETTAILSEDTANDFAEYKSDEKNKKTDLNEMIDETSKILDNTSDLLEEPVGDDDDTNNGGEEIDIESESFEDTNKQTPEPAEDDTVDKAFNDLMSDIDKLQKTWDKLKDFDDENVKSSEIDENGSYDYEEIDDANLEELFDNGHDSKKENQEEEVENIDENISENKSQETKTVNRMSEPILYLNDALVASDAENRNLLTTQNSDYASSSSMPETTQDTTTNMALSTEADKTEEDSQSVSNIEDLSSAEIDRLMKDFTEEHQKELKIRSADVRNAIDVRLTVDTPVVVTSPNYPLRYPTINTVDWMITGNGMGIELNITDFAVNGHAGHYLLVKPGGVDDTGSTGLLFTYTLNTERRYRFLDVDKMFLRFEAPRGMALRGFSLSMRMVVPAPGAPVEEPEPEPEPIEIPSPVATISLNLGGVSLDDFIEIEEQFRMIIADMATLYINTHNIDPGMNTTIESTQITNKALCFHNWPKFELCTEIEFGVPLVYEEDEESVEVKREQRLNETDLLDMWESLSQRDPFAVRLRMLGITEYQVPNDRGVLTIWLVIAGGVVISMAMLAFALWRFSCFADYTRMPSFSDTDSIKEKRNLDLYPTPHQTLPPLYSETDYKWADAKYDESAKVDMGGYSNKSYMHNDFFEIDSDEEVMTPRDRSSGFSPRDIYNV